MAHDYRHRHVTDEARRDLLKALGVAGAVGAGGLTIDGVREQMGETTAAAELAPLGEAIKNDLAGSIDAGLIASQQAEIATAASGLGASLERGLPESGPRTEFAAVAEAGQPVYDHLGAVGFFESTTQHLPEFTPEYLSKAVGGVVGAEALTAPLEDIDFVGGAPVDVLATVIGNAAALSEYHWVATDQIDRSAIEFGEYIPSMTKAATFGVLRWLSDLDHHLWQKGVLLTGDIHADAVWHAQSMAAGLQLVSEGAKLVGEESGRVTDSELSALLTTGFAVAAISQNLLPEDVYWITEAMRAPRA